MCVVLHFSKEIEYTSLANACLVQHPQAQIESSLDNTPFDCLDQSSACGLIREGHPILAAQTGADSFLA